jgi:hypothetical protein
LLQERLKICYVSNNFSMRHPTSKVWYFLWPLPVFTGVMAYADAIQGLTFTDIVKDVIVIDAATKKESTPKVGDVLVAPNVIKTGPDSRAELVAEDKTVTRVGSNTIFSVEANSRDVNLAQGSVLFNAPKGKGGGRIKSAGATASVLGTTFITSASPSGGFKVMGLEGSVQVDGSKGGSAKIGAGQLSFAMPGGKITPPMNFELKGSVAGSKLVGGFSKPLASIAKIEAAIAVQQAKIASGALASTGLLLGDRPDAAFQVDVSQIQSVVTEVVKQVEAAQETKTPSRSVVDPRFLKAVQESLTLLPSSSSTTASSIWQRITAGDTSKSYKGLTSTDSSTLWYTYQSNDLPPLISKNGVEYTQISSSVRSSDNATVLTYQGTDGYTVSTLNFVKDTTGGASANPAYPLFDESKTQFSLLGQVAPDSHVFEAANSLSRTGYSLFSAIPGDRTGLFATSSFVPVLVSKDLTLQLNSPDGKNGGAFFIAPTIENTDGNVGGAILTLNDLNLSGNIEIKPFDTITHSDLTNKDFGLPLLISVGHTLTISPGTLLRADTPLFEIYMAGAGYSPDKTLAELPVTTKTSLVLDRVALVNNMTGLDAILRVTAPAITIIDSAFQVLPASASSTVSNQIGSLIFESAGDITWTTNSTKPSLLPLGFGGNVKLSAEAFNIRVTSSKKAVTLNGVNLASNDARFSAVAGAALSPALSLTNVTFKLPSDFAFTRTLSGVITTTPATTAAVASSIVTVADSTLLSVGMLVTGTGIPAGTTIASIESATTVKLSQAATDSAGDSVALGLPSNFVSAVAVGDVTVSGLSSDSVVSTYLQSTAGNLTVTASEFGSVFNPSDKDPVTSFIAKATASNLYLGDTSLTGAQDLIYKVNVHADNVELFGGNDVFVSDVKIAPTDSTKGFVKVTATKNINVNKVDVTAYQISMTAGGDLNIHGKLTANSDDKTYTLGSLDDANKMYVTSTGKFTASAANNMVVNRVDFSAVQNVALDATTLVVRNTQFADGSTVELNSAKGSVAPNPGFSETNSIQKGMVNIMNGVKYGTTTVAFSNASSMTNGEFHTAAQTNLGNPLSNITIGMKTPTTTTVTTTK